MAENLNMRQMNNPDWDPCKEFEKHKSFLVEIVKRKKIPTMEIIRSTGMKNLAQANPREMVEIKKELKTLLPSWDANAIRRFHLPYCDAIIFELEESNYQETANYINQLYNLDENIRKEVGTGSKIWYRPRLKNQPNMIDRLKDNLMTAEKAGKLKHLVTQANTYLETALYFQSLTWEWWWISERLFDSALEIAETFNNPQLLATIRYLYGRFILNELGNPQKAVIHLNLALESSKGKVWNASRILGGQQQSVYKECNTLLYKALSLLVREIALNDSNLALETCKEALTMATDSGRNEFIVEALFNLGKYQVVNGIFDQGMQTLYKVLAMAKRIPDAQIVCNVHMELAFALKELGDSEGTVKHLRLFRETARDFNLNYELAQAHYYTGEYYLSKSQTELATGYLEKAFELYNEFGYKEEADLARIIAGVSRGQGIVQQYSKLILKCGDRSDSSAVEKLCMWKSCRNDFTIKEMKFSENETDQDELDSHPEENNFND